MRTNQELLSFLHTYQDLNEMGISRSKIGTLVRSGEIQCIRRGLYMLKKDFESIKPWEIRTINILSHFLSTKSTVFSHTSAATLLGMAVIGREDTVHVYCPPNSRGSHHKVVKHPRLFPETNILLTETGTKTTDVCTTVLDCCLSLPFHEAVTVADSATHNQLISPEELKNFLASYTGLKKRKAHQVAISFSALAESPGETLTRLLLDEMGLKYIEQYWVDISGQRYRADFYLIDYDAFVEFDGNIKYTDYLSEHEVIANERWRERMFLKQGAKIFRVTWNDVAKRRKVTRGELELFLLRASQARR